MITSTETKLRNEGMYHVPFTMYNLGWRDVRKPHGKLYIVHGKL